MRKTFVLDTSVLLYDKESISAFIGNDVVIPFVVLSELDTFKEKPGILGENARYVNRFLDKHRKDLREGVTLENGQTIKVDTLFLHSKEEIDESISLDLTSVDNKILYSCLLLQKKQENVVLITKDINLRVKADALGLKSEDFYRDSLDIERSALYQGYQELKIEDPNLIDELYLLSQDVSKDPDIRHAEELAVSEKLLEATGKDSFNENEYISVKCGSASFLGIWKKGKIRSILSQKQIQEKSGVKPKNKEQLFALDAILDKDIPLVSIVGIAGSGKTYITIAAAMEALNRKMYDKVIITRNVQSVGKDIGFLPGDVNEKMLPWLGSITDNFSQVVRKSSGGKGEMNGKIYFDMLLKQGDIEIAPISHIRGRTFGNCLIIFDEAQNSTIHEIKTVITRVAANTKIVLLGDIDQIDTPYIDSMSNGLSVIAEKFKNHDISAHITLRKGERSRLSEVAAKIL